jgi:hypothetical protein
MKNTNVENGVYSKDSLLVTDDEILSIQLYDEDLTDFKKGVAYLKEEYYYIYRGEKEKDSAEDLYPMPGIYKDPKDDTIYRIDPYTPDDKRKYSMDGKISSIDAEKIIEMVNNKEEILITIPESSKNFMPTINKDDDILKRLIKSALMQKGIDIDNYKNRFVDKNSLFNFKSNLRSGNRLSMLLFDRGVEALNLRYTITIEDKDSDNVVGTALNARIIASSEDNYDI